MASPVNERDARTRPVSHPAHIGLLHARRNAPKQAFPGTSAGKPELLLHSPLPRGAEAVQPENFAFHSLAPLQGWLRPPAARRRPVAEWDILEPGRNCWRIETARRAAVLIDACAYYRRLEQALHKARRSILIVGWDFDGRIRLRPNADDSKPLGDLLRSLVETHPEL